MFDDSSVISSSFIFTSSTDLKSTESCDLITPKNINNLPVVGAISSKNLLTNEILPTITIKASDSTAAETLAETTENLGKFTLTRTGDLTDSLMVYYAVDGTATNGQDYDTLTGIATFEAGSKTATIDIKPFDDLDYESKENVQLILQTDTDYNLGTAKSASVNLNDNDKPTISIIASDINAVETSAGEANNPGQFILTRTGNNSTSLTVNYNISGTAVNGQDYNTVNKSITFAAGSSTAVIDINPIDDGIDENEETVNLTLKTNNKYNLGTEQSATVNLLDREPTIITIEASDVSASETLAGETIDSAQFSLTRTGNTVDSLTVNYSIAGTAVNGQDYDNLTGNITFAPGSSTAVIDVNIIDDLVYEGDETIELTLADNNNYLLGNDRSASVSLIDNEIPSFIAVTSPNGGEVFNTDSTYTITWNDNIGENVKIELYKDGSFYSTINESTISDGSESWTVSSWILDGSDYTFKITSLSDSNLFDFSNSNFSIADWFSQSLQDSEITNLTRNLATDGQLNRNEIVNILRDTEDSNVVDASEIADLNTIINNAAKFNIQDYVVVLSDKVVNGDVANQKYQGSSLGNLFAGSSNTQMENLISKWFLGTDRPQSKYTYQYYDKPLFANGINPDDVKQGQVGDCYFLATLASIANEQPQYIQDMFIDNGDNTFTVRFFNKGVADYVTVDRYLPKASWGAAYANASNEMWVALAEKAYAQLAESGWSRSATSTNSYDSISGGWMSSVIPQVTNMSAVKYKNTNYVTKDQLIELSNSNKILAVGFVYGTVAADGIVNGHAYTITSYDAATDKFFLRNPWGNTHASVTWEQLVANKALFEWSL